MASKFKVSTQFTAIDKMTKPIKKMSNSVTRFSVSAENGLRRLDGGMNKVSKGVMAGAAAASAATLLLINRLNTLGGSLDVLAKTARRLDIPIEELQTLRFIGEQSGLAVGDMDKALGTFSKRLGELKKGSGALYSGLKKLNPELLKELQTTDSASEAFDIYIKGLRDTESATDQAAVASAAFSKSGMKLIQISHNSADAIAQMRKEAEENGLVTQQQAEDAEAYNDAMNRLSKTISGFTTSVLVPLYPMVTKIIDKMREWVIANKDLVSSKIGEMLKSTISFFKDYGKTLVKIVPWILGVIITMKSLIAVLTLVNLVMAANPMVWIIGGIVAAIAGLIAIGYTLYKNWDSITKSISDLWARLGQGFDMMMIKIVDAASSAWDALKSVFGWSPIGIIASNWNGITDYFKGLFSGIISLYDSLKGVFGWSPVSTIKASWSGITDYFSGLFDGVVSLYDSTVGKVMDAMQSAKSFLGFGGDEDINVNKNISTESVISPQERQFMYQANMRGSVDVNVYGNNGVTPEQETYTSQLRMARSGN